MNLRRKILVIVTPIVVAPLVLLWVTTYLTLNPVLKNSDAMREDLESLVTLFQEARQEARSRFKSATMNAYGFGLSNIGANFDGTLDGIEKSLLLSARRKELARFFSDPDEATTREAVVEYLEDLMLIHGLGEASVVSDDGKTLLEVQRIDSPEATVADDSGDALFERSDIGADVSTASWFRKATQVVERTSWDVYLSDAESSAESIPVISGAVAVPIAGGESPAGFVTFVLPLSYLLNEIRGPEELVSSIRLLGADGTEFWNSKGERDLNGGEEETLTISQSIRGGVLHAEVTLPSSVVFGNLAPFNRLSEALEAKLRSVESANADLQRTVDQTRNVVLAAKVALAGIALFLLFAFLGRVASKIELLNRVTLRIRDGELDASLPVFTTNDELSTLRENIDEMRRRIKEQIEKLDRKVAERTKELNAANVRLEKEVLDRSHAEERAVAASRAKSDFLATMSHEIRTPLSGIFGGTHLLLKSNLDEDQRTLAEVVESSTKTLQSLVNDILDFSKIEAGKLSLDEHPFDVAAAIREVCETLRFKAEEKEVALSFADEVRDSILRVGDSTRLKQIVYNLVGNAVKFTRHGSIKVVLTKSEIDKDGVCISIADTGIGMKPKTLEQIFDSFTQADSSISREFGGTGLGLAISSRLAALMHGSVSVESAIGEGSCFTLRVPLPYAVELLEPPMATRSLCGEVSEGARGRILFAEDNKDNRMILSRMLKSTGFAVTEVPDGRACVERAKESDYDLILMDCSMPVLDGCSATREIRAWEESGQSATRRLIVGLTANATATQRKDCFGCGMDDVLFKPLSGAMLVETCMRLIRQANERPTEEPEPI